MANVGKATATQIADWKSKNGSVYEYESIVDGDTHFTYCKEPTIDDIDYSHTVGEGKPIAMSKALYESVYLGGSDTAKSNDRVKRGVMAKLQSLCKSIEAIEKKL